MIGLLAVACSLLKWPVAPEITRDKAVEIARDFCEFSLEGRSNSAPVEQIVPALSGVERVEYFQGHPLFYVEFGNFGVTLNANTGQVISFSGPMVVSHDSEKVPLDRKEVSKDLQRFMNKAGFSGETVIGSLYGGAPNGYAGGNYRRIINGIESASENTSQFEYNYKLGRMIRVDFRDYCEPVEPPKENLDLDVIRHSMISLILKTPLKSSDGTLVRMEQVEEDANYPVKLRSWHPYKLGREFPSGYELVLVHSKPTKLVYDAKFYAKSFSIYSWYVVFDQYGHLIDFQGSPYATIGGNQNYFSKPLSDTLLPEKEIVVLALNERRKFRHCLVSAPDKLLDRADPLSFEIFLDGKVKQSRYFPRSKVIDVVDGSEARYFKPTGELLQFLEKKSRIAKRIKEGKPV